MWIFYLDFLLFQTYYFMFEEIKRKNTKTLNWFHVKKFPRLNIFRAVFHIKTVWFVVPLIILGKYEKIMEIWNYRNMVIWYKYGKFLTDIGIAQFVMPLIVFGKYEKWKVSTGLQIHPKKILKYTIKACKVREKDAQGT